MFPSKELIQSLAFLTVTVVAGTSLYENVQLKATANIPPTTVSLNSTPGNIWRNTLTPRTIANNWRVYACEGNAPLLCVSEKGKFAGTVEMARYSIKMLPDFRKMLTDAGISPEKTNYQNPKYKRQILTALNAWVANHYAVIAKDRQIGYGSKYSFLPTNPEAVTVGSLPALRYGFTGRQQNGSLQEHQIGYVAFDGKTLYIIKTGFDPGGDTGTLKTATQLRSFQPHLSKVVTQLRLAFSK
ncbi:MAG TPA: hypothetical protein V6D15_17375 [Oculatellaceae cyanobacterium]|jgi:hypothetical protein